MSIPHISGLSEIADDYDYFFFDIFGLLHNGVAVYPGTVACLQELKNSGKKICLVSNTPRRAYESSGDLEKHGIIPALYDGIVTAGDSAHVELRDKYQGRKVFFLGSEAFAGSLNSLDIARVETIAEADFILNCIPGTYQLGPPEIENYLRQGADRSLPMVCANPDLVVYHGDTLHICAGTYAAKYEDMGGHVSWHGKPFTQIYEMAAALLGNPSKDRICAAGDALRTDIAGANNFNIASLWALSGIHWEDLRFIDNPALPDPARVAAALDVSDVKPTATLTEFRW